MELKNVVRALRRHWIVVAILFVLVTAAGSLLAYLPPDRYQARATLLIQPNPEKAQINPQVIAIVIPPMLAKIESGGFRDRALETVAPDIRNAAVKVTAVDASGTGVLQVRTTSTRPDVVAPWANAIAKQLIAEPTGQGFVTIDLLDEARMPTHPYGPSRSPVVISSVFLAAIIATLGAIATAAYRLRVDEVDEIRSRFGTAVLGEVPTIGRMSRDKRGMLVGGEVPPAVVEALQGLRTNVEFLLSGREVRSVAVVSATSGEGKSTITVALAWALASVGLEVTAVDADLRRPVLHKHFDGKLTPGVSSVGRFQLEGLLQSTELASLTFLSAGLPDRHPAEILRANLPGVLQSLSDRGRTVMIDCPPLVGLAETTFLTSLASSVILVVDRKTHDLVDVERALALLHDHGADVLGVVINRTRRKLPKSDYYDSTVRRGKAQNQFPSRQRVQEKDSPKPRFRSGPATHEPVRPVAPPSPPRPKVESAAHHVEPASPPPPKMEPAGPHMESATPASPSVEPESPTVEPAAQHVEPASTRLPYGEPSGSRISGASSTDLD